MKAKAIISKSLKYIVDKEFRWGVNQRRGLYDHLSDEEFLKKRYKNFFGRELNLHQPKTLCEKIQWLKLYNRKPEYTMMVDKYEAKKYVAEIIGEEHIIQTYGIYDHFDEIDFSSLPDQFILKCTHNSGGFVVCEDKSKFNIKEAQKILDKGLKKNYYLNTREWAYKDVKPRIIAEKYMESLGKPNSTEYKVTCFDGKVGFVTICKGVPHTKYEQRTNDHFDKDFNYLPFWVNYKHATVRPDKPSEWDELINICEKLSKNIPYVRIDTYIIEGVIYFGEITFYTWAGFMNFNPPEWDLKLGNMVKLLEKTV